MTKLQGCFAAYIDGEDLLVPCNHQDNPQGIVTSFGGIADVLSGADNGETESGVFTARKLDGSWHETGVFGCALPIRSIEKATAPSPLAFKGPHIPWKTMVRFWLGDEQAALSSGEYIEVELIDNGPDVSRFPHHIGDLTPAAVVALLSRLKLPSMVYGKITSLFSLGLSYRVLGAAKYVS